MSNDLRVAEPNKQWTLHSFNLSRSSKSDPMTDDYTMQ
jgi:hypothetical protein